MKEQSDSGSKPKIKEIVREKYGEAARKHLAQQASTGSCCGSGREPDSVSCCTDPISKDLYDADEARDLPQGAFAASLGCGNPTALATLAPGEIVLDLGSGGGVDVLLSAKRVGPTGFAYGLDMTDEMLALAERHKAEAGIENVRFLKGEIEKIPLPDASVDVVISNCVINLSADKDAVLREAFRVLRPGGRFAVSDVVVEGELPDAIRRDVLAYVGCVAGALERTDYERKLARAGFAEVSITPTRRYTLDDVEDSGCCSAGIADLSPAEKEGLDGRIYSAFIRGVKPGV